MKLTFDKKVSRTLNIMIIFSYFLCLSSIPICSFLPKLNIISWILTIILCLLIAFDFLIKRSFYFDAIIGMIIVFAFSTIISSSLNGFTNFNLTPTLMSIIVLITYTYSKQNKNFSNVFPLITLVSIFLFAVAFLIVYLKDILVLDINRLGSKFGDENDVGMCFAIGCAVSSYLFLKTKKILKIPFLFAFLLFGLLGLLTGSKMFVFSVVAELFIAIFVFFGRKKIWISISVCAVLVFLFVVSFFIPAFNVFTSRFLSFFKTFFSPDVDYSNVDYSSISRMKMFIDGIVMFLRKPLFGYGTQGFFTYSSFGGGWSHNTFSELLCNYGIIGLIWFAPFIISIRLANRNRMLLIVIILLVFLFYSFSVVLFTEKLFAFLIGPIFGLSNIKSYKFDLSGFIKKSGNKGSLLQ